MYISISFHKILPQHIEDYKTNMNVCAAATNQEPGCIRYEVLQDNDDPSMMCLMQYFKDADAYQFHQDAPHHKHWVEISRDWRDRSVTQRNEMQFVTQMIGKTAPTG